MLLTMFFISRLYLFFLFFFSFFFYLYTNICCTFFLKVLLDDSTLTVLPHRSTKTESHGIGHRQILSKDVCVYVLKHSVHR